LFLVWLMMPLTTFWIHVNNTTLKLALDTRKFLNNVFVFIAIVLSLINLLNYHKLQDDFGKHFIHGYYMVWSHDCYAPNGNTPPSKCLIADLSGVVWYWHPILYLFKWIDIALVILIPVSTHFIGKIEIEKSILREDDH
ncbi:MAG: hypothetical protein ACYDCY_10345, partial [Metallibacterium sp.]